MRSQTFETRNRVTIKERSSLRGAMDVQVVPTRSVKPSPHNARTHSKKQIRQIADSILKFKWTYPLLVDERWNIIAGHGRHLAALELGLKNVPVIVMAGLREAEKRALALADNKIAANAGWDRNLLAAELGDLAGLLPEYDLDIEITGFEAGEVDALLGDLIDPEDDPTDSPPGVADLPISRTADFWLLGHHCLVCGDARADADMRALMGRNRAAMVFADPPYNLRISSVQGRGKIKHREFASGSGEMTGTQFTEFLAAWMKLAAGYSIDGSIHFVCMDWRHLKEIQAAAAPIYAELKNLVVWSKSNAGQGSFYRSQHELIFVFKNGEGPTQNNVELGKHGRNRGNVWTYAGVNTFRANRMDELSLHPTVKPIALVADAMRDCSRRNEIVLDPFMGSGTTILAAEKVGRRAFGLEIDPLYVDVAIRRWQAFTKLDAILKATGQTFDEICAERNAPSKRGNE